MISISSFTNLAEANDLVGILTEVDFNDHEKLGSGTEIVNRLATLSLFSKPGTGF